MEQRSDEWFQARLGKITASRISDVIARTRSGYGASRANYMSQLLVERLTKQPTESYINGAMQWGIDTEPRARAAYEFFTETPVQEIGFIDHPSILMTGASPDGLIGDDGMLEIKCPNTATHLDTLLKGAIADKYVVQMQWQLACANRQWCDFVSYDDRLPPEHAMYVKRIERDDERIGDLESEVRKFLSELADMEKQLQERLEKAA